MKTESVKTYEGRVGVNMLLLIILSLRFATRGRIREVHGNKSVLNYGLSHVPRAWGVGPVTTGCLVGFCLDIFIFIYTNDFFPFSPLLNSVFCKSCLIDTLSSLHNWASFFFY